MPQPRYPLATCVKVAVALLLLDVLLFRVGLVWRLSPPAGVWWRPVYEAARLAESGRLAPDTIVAVGSSVVVCGVGERRIEASLRAAGRSVRVVNLGILGGTATDAALLAAAVRRLRPALLVFGASFRDFNRTAGGDTAAMRTFYDASVSLPIRPREGLEDILQASAQRYWRLYRYRFFVREIVTDHANRLFALAQPPAAPMAAPAIPTPVSPEQRRIFAPYMAVSPEAFATWERWRQSRRFADYFAWMRVRNSVEPEIYRTNLTREALGPENNPHLAAVDWVLASLERAGVRTLVIAFPENPAFLDREAAPYFDPELSAALAAGLDNRARAHGARFIDWRAALDADDFLDLVHPNLLGVEHLAERFAALVAEEWPAPR